MYNILVKPFEEPKMNRLEIFNEVCILAAAYHLFLFTDYIESPEFRYKIGWSITSITTFNTEIAAREAAKVVLPEFDRDCCSQSDGKL